MSDHAGCVSSHRASGAMSAGAKGLVGDHHQTGAAIQFDHQGREIGDLFGRKSRLGQQFDCHLRVTTGRCEDQCPLGEGTVRHGERSRWSAPSPSSATAPLKLGTPRRMP